MKIPEDIIALKSNAYIFYRAIQDPRTAWYIKCLTLVVLAYIISPIDLVPDFIPVLGFLDEAILVPIAISLIIWMVPEEVINDYRIENQDIKCNGLGLLGTVIILAIWLLTLWSIYMLWHLWY